MKKLLLLCLLVLLCACLFQNFAFADGSTSYQNTDIYKDLTDFLTTCPKRTGTEYELATANYLFNYFNQLGLEVQTQQVPYAVYGYETYNVVAQLNRGGDGCIVIGAHYDALGEGANDNASGITALLQIAKKLIPYTNLPFDVIFVAFGGEEQGFFGSQYFVDNYARDFKKPLSNIRLMINMDSIANGDNLYIHCENKQTDIAKLFLSNQQGAVTIVEKPYAVGTYSLDAYGYGYYETVQGSDHTPFRVAGVPVANFFSGNFIGWDYVESATESKNTMNTANDTLQSLNQNNGGEWVSKIDTVVNTVVNTVTNASFDDVSKNAREQLVNLDFWYRLLWPKLVVVGILIVLAVLAINHNRKLQKQAILGTAEVKNNRVFDTPDANDIFTFDK